MSINKKRIKGYSSVEQLRTTAKKNLDRDRKAEEYLIYDTIYTDINKAVSCGHNFALVPSFLFSDQKTMDFFKNEGFTIEEWGSDIRSGNQYHDYPQVSIRW